MTILHTSWSEIDTARHCLYKHQLRYKERWRSIEEAAPLARGTMWHTLLELLYTTKDAEAPVEQLREWTDEGHSEAELLAWMLDGYYEAWGIGDPGWTKHVADVELEFLLPLPDIGAGELNLKGFIDLTLYINKKLWIVDHKSGAQPPRRGELEMADQWTLYTWAMREQGMNVFGSIHNYAKTAQLVRPMTSKERFQRIPIHRTDREVEAVVREATIQAHQAKADNGAPRSPGEMCNRRCDFLDHCIADRRHGTNYANQILINSNTQEERDK